MRKGPDAMDYNYYLLCKYDLAEGIVRTKIPTWLFTFSPQKKRL